MTDVGVRAWRRCDTVYECIQAVRLWRIQSVFTAAEIISKCEKDAWSRQIHSVTCTRSTQLPRDVINATEQEATANRKLNHCGKVCCPLGSVSTCVCKSSVFMHSLIHGCVCVWWEEVCREAVRVINRCLQSSAGGFSYRDETEENRFVTASPVGRDSPTADALL